MRRYAHLSDRLRRWLFAPLLVLTVACATLPSFPPRLPNGTLDVLTLIAWASDGIEADCALGFNVDICTYGRATITDVRLDLAADPDHPKAAVGRSLARSAFTWPVVAPYVQWVRDLVKE